MATAPRPSSPITSRIPLAAGTNELRISLAAESLSIVGEDRADIDAELRVWSNGFDDAEAQELAKATTLKPVEGAGSVTIGISYPQGGRQRANVVLRVPSRLRLQMPLTVAVW